MIIAENFQNQDMWFIDSESKIHIKQDLKKKSMTSHILVKQQITGGKKRYLSSQKKKADHLYRNIRQIELSNINNENRK